MALVEHHFVQHLVISPQEFVGVDHVALTLDAETGNFILDERHAESQRILPLAVGSGEKAHIKTLALVYCANDTGIPLSLRLEELFPPREGVEGTHPDATGVVHFEIPGMCSGQIPLRQQVIYVPNTTHLGFDVRPYLGMESAISQGHSTAVIRGATPKEEVDLFADGDPLLSFMLTAPKEFPEVRKGDIVRLKGVATQERQIIYSVPKKATARVRSFFRDTVCPMIRYSTAATGFRLRWEVPVTTTGAVVQRDGRGFRGVILVFRVEYDVLAPCAPRFEIQRYKF